VNDVANDPNVINDWIYAGAQERRDIVSGVIRSMPYNVRIFALPKTHALTLHKRRDPDEIDFAVWCLSFFIGMRLTTVEAGFLDATPITPGKLIDFVLSRGTLADSIQVALNYLESERSNPRAPKRVAAAIHALFLAQNPQNLPFEEFQYLYMALDACFQLVASKETKMPPVPHSRRIQWTCEKFGMPVPSWAEDTQAIHSPLSIVRNDTFHEALFFGWPLGFSVYGGNGPSENQRNVILQMQSLICRLLVAILVRPEVGYVHTPVDTRQRHGLELLY